MKIRRLKEKEIPNLGRLIKKCIKKDFGHYLKRKILSMESYSSQERLKKYFNDWEVFVFIGNKEIKGTISL